MCKFSLVSAELRFYNGATCEKGSGVVRRLLLLILGAGGSAMSICLLLCNVGLMNVGASVISKHTKPEEITLPYCIPGTSLVVQKLVCYEGPYLEDGKADEVVDVAAVILENTGSDGIQEAMVELAWDGGCYSFSAYMIPAGESVLVCDEKRQLFGVRQWISCVGIASLSVDDWNKPEWICLEEHNWGELEITNISGKFLADIEVLYKGYLSPPGVYIGGSFYRLIISELAPGETATVTAWGYVKGSSKVVYIGCKQRWNTIDRTADRSYNLQ